MNRLGNICKAIDALKLSDLKVVDGTGGEGYLYAYGYIAQYFDQLPTKLEYEHFVIATHVVYAWMPRVLTIHISEDEVGEADQKKLLSSLNTARNQHPNDTLREDNLNLSAIAKPFNGSLVAPSKLLHFLNPTAFPIWDSRVYRGVLRATSNEVNGPYHYEMTNVELYIKYVNKLRELNQGDQSYLPKASIDGDSGVRRIEWALFRMGKK